MRRSIRLAAAMAGTMLLVPAAAVQATPPLEGSFEVQTAFIDGGPLSGGPFTASGPAVDAGSICAAGNTIDQDLPMAAAYQSSTGVNLRIVKQFSCADGSGGFWITLNVRLDARGDNFVWVISNGTGAYERLHGTGSGTGDPTSYGVLDRYEGAFHLD